MIILAATPIGNLADASPRLRETLRHATVIAAEDTRRTLALLRLLEIDARPEIVSLHDHNEYERATVIVGRAKHEDVVLVSDAGMPTVSDPGFRVVELAAKAGVPVTAIPGPSAVITALAVSGLPTDRFTFEGFPPRKPGPRRRAFDALNTEQRTMVFFEAPSRLGDTLAAMADSLGGDRPAAICRELTKLHEEVRRGTLAELVEWAQDEVRGEVVVVVRGASPQAVSVDTAVRMALQKELLGTRLKDAARETSTETGVSSRTIYEAALEAKGKRS